MPTTSTPVTSIATGPPAFFASTIAQTRPGCEGEAATPARPHVSSGSPSDSFVQVSPPSAERHSDDPGPPETSSHGLRTTCQNAA